MKSNLAVLNLVRSMLMLLLLAVVAVSCKRDKDDDEETLHNPTPLNITIPSNLPQMNIPSFNPTTLEGVELGRRLYYDSIMDPLGARACASCHIQSAGFTTPGTNIIPHINLGYNKRFLWDGSVEGTLEAGMKFEVEDFFNTDVGRLQSHPEYPDLFFKAFGSRQVTSQNCAYALAQYLRTMVSGNSKFDKYQRFEVPLNYDEMQGYILFNTEKGDCFHCHTLPLSTDGVLHNIGLDSVFATADQGYFHVTGDSADLGKFKTPSLRNAGIRTSFMHDGRFSTLDEVIEHYNSRVKNSASLDPILTKPGKEFGLQLNATEKAQLKAFLETLTDTTYLTEPRFSSPF